MKPYQIPNQRLDVQFWDSFKDTTDELTIPPAPFKQKTRVVLTGDQEGIAIGDIFILAGLADQFRALNLELTCITNPSMAPILPKDVFTVIPNTLSRQEIQNKLNPYIYYAHWFDLFLDMKDKHPYAVPFQKSYLNYDRDLAAQYRRAYKLDANQKVYGICWRTNNYSYQNANRNSTLAQWTPLIQREVAKGHKFVSVQYGDVNQIVTELTEFYTQTKTLIQHRDAWRDTGLYAAHIASCDGIFTIDCSTTFLAGAIGKPTFTALPAIGQDQDDRWQGAKDTCPFFASNKIFRQTSAENDYRNTINRVALHIHLNQS